jgi:hypothetical protein
MDFTGIDNEDFQAEVPYEDGTVTIRYVSPEEMTRLSAKATKRVRDGRGEWIEKYDNAKGNQLLGEVAVLGWTGLTKDGEPFVFSPDNRDMLMTRSWEFIKFVNRTCLDFQALRDAEREKIRGN